MVLTLSHGQLGVWDESSAIKVEGNIQNPNLLDLCGWFRVSSRIGAGWQK